MKIATKTCSYVELPFIPTVLSQQTKNPDLLNCLIVPQTEFISSHDLSYTSSFHDPCVHFQTSWQCFQPHFNGQPFASKLYLIVRFIKNNILLSEESTNDLLQMLKLFSKQGLLKNNPLTFSGIFSEAVTRSPMV